MSYKIALYPGDGGRPRGHRRGTQGARGPSASFDFTLFDWNCGLYASTGSCAPEDYLDRLMPFDAILLGALGDAEGPDHIAVEPLLAMRKGFDQYVNIRPRRALRRRRLPAEKRQARRNRYGRNPREHRGASIPASGSTLRGNAARRRRCRSTTSRGWVPSGSYDTRSKPRVNANAGTSPASPSPNALKYSMVFLWTRCSPTSRRTIPT